MDEYKAGLIGSGSTHISPARRPSLHFSTTTIPGLVQMVALRYIHLLFNKYCHTLMGSRLSTYCRRRRIPRH